MLLLHKSHEGGIEKKVGFPARKPPTVGVNKSCSLGNLPPNQPTEAVVRTTNITLLGPAGTRTAMLGVVLLLLSLSSSVFMVPPPNAPCRKCCDYMSAEDGSGEHPATGEIRHTPEIRAYINMTILKGDKGDRGDRGTPGKVGHEGPPGAQGVSGSKGSKGQAGPPGDPCKLQYSAFSVARRKSLHSDDAYQAVIFDTVFVNLHGSFDMFQGRFLCHVAGVYFFNVNIHTWNFKETYLHIMQNDTERAIVYAQPSDRSIMQSQSVMLELRPGDAVWVRLFKRERENAIYSDDVDVYITFNGYLIKPSEE